MQEYRTLLDTPYQRYLADVCLDEHAVHRGYFSIDKKTGRSVNSELKRGSEFSDDISAYDLILKNKERLLSFEEPTRFIFSHSALREGWDNPNVFQICTLRHTDSTTAKRQEVGRGLRLCVDSYGNRMDVESCGDVVHDINVLTVIANTIEFYLIANGYIDMDRKVTDKYRTDLAAGNLAAMPADIAPMAEGVHKLVQAVFDESVLDDMFTDGHETKIKDNPLNDNFYKKEF